MSSDDFLAGLPPIFHDVPYAGSRFPGASGVNGVEEGANCQLYAYEVLRHFGWEIPPLRSSDLWADEASTRRVDGPLRPLDLMLFGDRKDAYGAHVGLYLGNGRVLHLSREVGHPAVWTLEDFRRRARYRRVFIKRPILRHRRR